MGRNRKKPYTEIDRNTFGSSNGAEVLAKILNENRNSRLLQKVSAYLSHNAAVLNSLFEITNPSHRLTCINLIADKIKTDKFENIPDNVTTYTRNVAMTQVKVSREHAENQVLMLDVPPVPGGVSGPEFEFTIT